MINESEYKRTKLSITRCLRRFMVPIDAEDLTQEFYCRKLEGRSEHQTIEFFVIDYLRKYSGRKGQPGYNARINKEFFYGELPEDNRSESTNYLLFNDASENIRNYNGLFKRFKKLKLLGYTNREISKYEGVSESRITQRFKQIQNISEKINIVEMLNITSKTFEFIIRNLK